MGGIGGGGGVKRKRKADKEAAAAGGGGGKGADGAFGCHPLDSPHGGFFARFI